MTKPIDAQMPVARAKVTAGSTFTKWLTKLPDGVHDLYTQPTSAVEQQTQQTNPVVSQNQPEMGDKPSAVEPTTQLNELKKAQILHLNFVLDLQRVLSWEKTLNNFPEIEELEALLAAYANPIAKAEPTAQLTECCNQTVARQCPGCPHEVKAEPTAQPTTEQIRDYCFAHGYLHPRKPTPPPVAGDAELKAMLSAHALCPIDIAHLDRMRWMANYMVKALNLDAAIAAGGKP